MIFRDMTEAEKKYFMDKITEHFTETLVLNEVETAESAPIAAIKLFDGLLSDEGTFHFFRTLESDGKAVGYIWYKTAADSVKYGYSVYLYTEISERGKGLGRELLNRFEAEARKMGCVECRLCVWKSNPVARHLYDTLEYVPRETIGNKTYMKKVL